MGKADKKDLLRFMKPFPPDMQARALWLRDFVWDMYPTSNELIYDNYNALAFGWSITDRLGHVFCTMAMGRTSGNLHFGFYYGAALSDPEKLLIGKGNQYRYLLVHDLKKFPAGYIKKLIKEAYAHSLGKLKDKSALVSGKTITKSISHSKRILARKTKSESSGKPKKKVKK
ncbi:MAG: hypothetical protein JNL40_14675 [Cyclobacteriaceae bacterium]|nr:hypothetical protein [Cyclobacteriaceae bacterium]